MPPKNPKPSVRLLARKTGVSVATISRYFSGSGPVGEAVGHKIQQAAERLGYERRPVGRRRELARRCLGLLVAKRMRPEVVADPVLEEVRDRLGLLAQEVGFDLVTLEHHEGRDPGAGEAFFRKRLLFEGFQGVFLYGDWHPEGMPAYCRKRLLPLVRLNRNEGPDAAVFIDQESLGFLATRHLLELGHARVALLLPADAAGMGEARRAGWQRAHVERGTAPGPEWFLPTAGIRQGYDAVRRTLAKAGRRGGLSETALFCNNDATAIGAIRAFHEAGFAVPKDISLVGCDDLEGAAHTVPSLTTVKQDFAALCEGALRLMRQAVERQVAGPPKWVIEPRLIPRESSQAPPTRIKGTP